MHILQHAAGHFFHHASQLWTDRKGVTAVEYGLIAAMIAAGLVTGVGKLTTGLHAAFTTIQNALATA